ncbi:MAG TPA: hypothetical protein VLM75_13105 [Spirochaetota bacterium]|nr:hypothetical protein [Spirochaetota bacterium]
MRHEINIEDESILAGIVRDRVLDAEAISAFRGLVYRYYARHGK